MFLYNIFLILFDIILQFQIFLYFFHYPNPRSKASLSLPLLKSYINIFYEKLNIYGPIAGIYGATSVPNINTFCGFNRFPAEFYPFYPKNLHILKIVSTIFLSCYDILSNCKSKILFDALFINGIYEFYNPIVLNIWRTAPFDKESIPSTR
jgi:hypothetical protein